MTPSSQSDDHDLTTPMHRVKTGLIPITISKFFNDLLARYGIDEWPDGAIFFDIHPDELGV